MIRNAVLGLALVGALGLGACQTYAPTPYQPAAKGERGYSETRIESDRWLQKGREVLRCHPVKSMVVVRTLIRFGESPRNGCRKHDDEQSAGCIEVKIGCPGVLRTRHIRIDGNVPMFAPVNEIFR